MIRTIILAATFIWSYLALGGSEPEFLERYNDPPHSTLYAQPSTTTAAPPVPAQPVEAPVAVTSTVIWADDRRQPIPPPAAPGIMHHCPQWEAEAIAQGWPIDQLDRLDHVMWRESRCLPDAHNVDDPTQYGSRGLMQINGFWVYRLELDAERLFEPAYNLRVALLAYAASGWSPWGLS